MALYQEVNLTTITYILLPQSSTLSLFNKKKKENDYVLLRDPQSQNQKNVYIKRLRNLLMFTTAAEPKTTGQVGRLGAREESMLQFKSKDPWARKAGRS